MKIFGGFEKQEVCVGGKKSRALVGYIGLGGSA